MIHREYQHLTYLSHMKNYYQVRVVQHNKKREGKALRTHCDAAERLRFEKKETKVGRAGKSRMKQGTSNY